jgi:Trypsin
MRHLLPASSRRSTALTAAVLSLVACLLGVLAATAGAAVVEEGPLVPFVVGGQESSISQFPWQVFVYLPSEKIECGGSILTPTTILTAAHCVDHQGTTTPYPAGDVMIMAGASNVNQFAPPAAEMRFVAAIRTHPYYTPPPNIKDDAAVLTLTEPLTLSSTVRAIPLVATGATPAAGTALSVSGYGKEEGSETAQPSGKLFAASLIALSSDACRSAVGEPNSAVLLCAVSPTAATCQGDSGGPLTEGSPPVEVGIVDVGPAGCPVGEPDGFTNLAAPEVRAFIEGSEAPPVAARPTALPALKTIGADPVDYSPLICEAGAWSGSPSFTYTFQVDNAAAQMLQSGPNNAFAPPSTVVGLPVVCIVQASNAGGVTTFRTGTTPPIAADTVRPGASISALKCHLQACTLSFVAFDPNAVALSVSPAALYTVTVRCPKKKKRAKRGKKPATCHATKALSMSLKGVAPGAFRATVSRLPYDKKITFTVTVANAAGLRPLKPPARATILHPPRKKRTSSRH